ERDHDDVAGPAELGGDMEHPVVAGMRERRHSGARDSGARINWAHVAAEKPGAPLCLVHGSNAELRQGVDDLERCALDVAYGYVPHGITPWKCLKPPDTAQRARRHELLAQAKLGSI